MTSIESQPQNPEKLSQTYLSEYLGKFSMQWVKVQNFQNPELSKLQS